MKLKNVFLIGALMLNSNNVNAGALSDFIFNFTINAIGNKLQAGFEKGTPITGAGVCTNVTTGKIAGTYNLTVLISYVSPSTWKLVTEQHNITYNRPIGVFSTFTIHGIIGSEPVGNKIPIKWNSITNIIADPGKKGIADFNPESMKNLLNFSGNKTIH
jgi:hypothetical protein